MKKIIFLILLSAFFLTSCEIKEISVGMPTNFDVQELSLKSIKLKIFIPINNPNDFSFKVKDADVDLFVGSTKIGKITNFDKIKIEKNINKEYPVYFEIATKEALSQIFTLYNELRKSKPNLLLDGKITVSKGIVIKKIQVHHSQKIF